MLEVHIQSYNEVEIITYAFRHYTSIADRVILHDMGSTDGTLEVAAKFGIGTCPWDTKNLVDETVNMKIRNECWLGTDADWVIVADTDEFVYFPSGVKETLQAYEKQNLPIAVPHGWEMFSETMPTGEGQIYDEIKMGARDDRWYAKPVLFNPRLVSAIDFGPGAHGCDAWLWDGSHYVPSQKSDPAVYLLHYHQIGGLNRVAARYDDHRARMSQSNKDHNWGNVHLTGIEHCTNKRNSIIPRLEKVLA